MAKEKKHRPEAAPVKGAGSGARGSAGAKARASGGQTTASGGEHHAAKAHGRPARVDTSLPGTRPELMALHAEARKRRAAAPLGSEAFRAAVEELGRIEIRIADVDRAQDPPLG
jgi:hypothetical protein